MISLQLGQRFSEGDYRIENVRAEIIKAESNRMFTLTFEDDHLKPGLGAREVVEITFSHLADCDLLGPLALFIINALLIGMVTVLLIIAAPEMLVAEIVLICVRMLPFLVMLVGTGLETFCVLREKISRMSDELFTSDYVLEERPSFNARETEVMQDSFSLEELSVEEVKQPRWIKVGPYISDAFAIIKRVLRKRASDAGALVHPVHNGYMTADEQKKFIKDAALFLALDQQRLHNCWNGWNSPIESFKNCLPRDIVSNYCNGW